MPELPEVETIRTQLEPLLVGSIIVKADSHPSAKFTDARKAVDHTIKAIRRRGKYLLLELSTGNDISEMVIHLGMTGRLLVLQNLDDNPYCRAHWTLKGGREFIFYDVRRFGRIALVPANDYRSLPTLHQMGPEPFDPELNAESFYARLKCSRRRIKTNLLSQRPLAGIGNIYADEALWRSCIHPATRRISQHRCGLLLKALREVLTEALANHGTTLNDYRTALGESGSHQNQLKCYGLSGQPCSRCGTILRRGTLDQRTSTWCPSCQKG